MLQQSICHVRESNWTFSVSWGYSVHIYEKIFPRSHLKLPIETFRPWYRGRPPVFMFNTRPVSRDSCEAPHWFFFDSIEKENDGVVTSYTRKFIRNMTSCSFSGNISADPIASIRVFSSKTPRQVRSPYDYASYYICTNTAIFENLSSFFVTFENLSIVLLVMIAFFYLIPPLNLK